MLRYQAPVSHHFATRSKPATASGQVSTALPADRPGTPTGAFPGWFVSETTGWMTVFANGHGELQKTTDAGRTWTMQLSFSFPRVLQRDMKFLDANHGFIVVLNPSGGQAYPYLYQMTDGNSWHQVTLPQSGRGTVDGVDFVDPVHGWVLFTPNGSRDSSVYGTGDGGISWTLLSASTMGNATGLDSGTHMEGMRFVTPLEGWISAWRSSIPGNTGQMPGGPVATPFFYVTRDGGHTWGVQTLPSPQSVSYPAVIGNIEPPHFFNAEQGIAAVVVGSKSNQQVILYSSSDGGQTWKSPVVFGQGSEAWAAYDAKHVWVAGTQMLRFDGSNASDTNSLPSGVVIGSLDFGHF